MSRTKTKERKKNPARKKRKKPSGNTSGRFSYQEWKALKEEFITSARRSSMLTKEDLGIRINARG